VTFLKLSKSLKTDADYSFIGGSVNKKNALDEFKEKKFSPAVLSLVVRIAANSPLDK